MEQGLSRPLSLQQDHCRGPSTKCKLCFLREEVLTNAQMSKHLKEPSSQETQRFISLKTSVLTRVRHRNMEEAA